jgi:hypothetical protein
MNKRQKGQRNKLKTKKWLEVQGYVVENSEVNKICFFNKKLFAVHKDLFGSDLLAMNGKEIIFVQCKTNKVDMLSGVKEFAKYPFPSFIQRWVVRWELRAKEPIIRKL